MDQDIDMPAKLNKAIENLPDDLIIHIYTKILKKYKKLNHKFSLQKFLFGEIEPQEYFI